MKERAGASDRGVEVNFDGIIGPTHHYGGLSTGNIASLTHKWEVSRPREAALQGLAKMDLLARRGIPQAVLPPQERPAFSILRAAGFSGSEEEILRDASKEVPGLLSACYSASAMWTANAATFSPAEDTRDGRSHFTPANLFSMFHRSIEPPLTGGLLAQVFGDRRYFVHHEPLPAGRLFSDEGAANHTRLTSRGGGRGIHLFAYGFSPFEAEPQLRFPARQSLEASRAVARLHGLAPERCLFAQQAPEAIEAGVFHNDVAAVGHENLFLYHEQAYVNGDEVVSELKEMFAAQCGGELLSCRVPAKRVSLEEAVRTYLFNSQLVTLPEGTMLLLAPRESGESDEVRSVIRDWVGDEMNPIAEVVYTDLRQSMRNGGGPACLRLRVVLSSEERDAMRGRLMLTPELSASLADWIRRNYRETLSVPDLADPRLLEEGRRALKELRALLELEA